MPLELIELSVADPMSVVRMERGVTNESIGGLRPGRLVKLRQMCRL